MHDHRTTSEEYFLSLIADGVIAIADDGRIFRVRDFRRVNPTVSPRSIEYETSCGYRSVRLRAGNRVFSMKSHRLVYRHLVGPIPEGMEINHKNGIKTDNRPENLEVVTKADNMRHAYANGLIRPVAGERNGNSRISDVDAVEIRRAYGAGEGTQRSLADKFGVTRSAIGYLVRGQTRACFDGPTSTDNVRRKLDDDQRREVISLWSAGVMTKQEIADCFGVTRTAVYFILKKAAVVEAS